MATLAEVLADARARAGLSQSELARRRGVGASTVNSQERGKSGISTDQLEATVQATGRTIVISPSGWRVYDADLARDGADEPAAAQDLARGSSLLPVRGSAGAGGGRWNVDWIEEWVVAPDAIANRVSGLVRVVGTSMEPLLWDGDLVGVRETEDPRPGNIVVVSIDGETLIKAYGGTDIGGHSVFLSLQGGRHLPIIATPDQIAYHGIAFGLIRDGELKVEAPMAWPGGSKLV